MEGNRLSDIVFVKRGGSEAPRLEVDDEAKGASSNVSSTVKEAKQEDNRIGARIRKDVQAQQAVGL